MKATLLLFALGKLFMQPIVGQQFKFWVDVCFANESEPIGSNRFNLGSFTGRAISQSRPKYYISKHRCRRKCRSQVYNVELRAYYAKA